MGDAPLMSTYFWLYLASNRRISAEAEGMNSRSLASSQGMPAPLHNSVIKIGNVREICF